MPVIQVFVYDQNFANEKSNMTRGATFSANRGDMVQFVNLRNAAVKVQLKGLGPVKILNLGPTNGPSPAEWPSSAEYCLPVPLNGTDSKFTFQAPKVGAITNGPNDMCGDININP